MVVDPLGKRNSISLERTSIWKVHKGSKKSTKASHPSKKRKYVASISQTTPFETIDVIDDDDRIAQRIRVSFSKPLMNPFEGSVFGEKDKLDELYHYFVYPNDEVEITKARSEESKLVHLMAFK